ncbi:hypothetical protein [Halorubrum vacuolatum]|uniref:Uncharacterized protein n=1 Tax=Halorubrum vacuolatum TaxID=63740 RepID=A0A238WTE8_HALVU|nr:hypothetical protein [Halorubrum vacuolatum]SNR49832.1 hypothetical protein SAMN06264855_11025 [Halorubrum vacuolatum]
MAGVIYLLYLLQNHGIRVLYFVLITKRESTQTGIDAVNHPEFGTETLSCPGTGPEKNFDLQKHPKHAHNHKVGKQGFSGTGGWDFNLF